MCVVSRAEMQNQISYRLSVSWVVADDLEFHMCDLLLFTHTTLQTIFSDLRRESASIDLGVGLVRHSLSLVTKEKPINMLLFDTTCSIVKFTKDNALPMSFSVLKQLKSFLKMCAWLKM